jgi:hypothetical protein
MASVQTARLLVIFIEKDLDRMAWGEIKCSQRGRTNGGDERTRRVSRWRPCWLLGWGAYIEGERLGFR